MFTVLEFWVWAATALLVLLFGIADIMRTLRAGPLEELVSHAPKAPIVSS
ncbi:hypothetical protein MPL3365_130587 [Mesorhizobium plurifarium]|uniref:Uncharacterized protein n=1 Tax=Mesorhizobium plurifarium TaxID=69974 RepID=A0A090GSZ8_MESPL|nr:hypothetical protein MPL3365_130587 [Mesorhizobium plurifarium]